MEAKPSHAMRQVQCRRACICGAEQREAVARYVVDRRYLPTVGTLYWTECDHAL